MVFKRNKMSSNPNRRKMTVADMSHPILKENKKVLELLDEMDKKKFGFFKRKGEKTE